MGVLDQVTQMRNQGLSDSDIVSQLQEDGFHPKTINDALAQADIKSAVDNGMEEMEPTTNQYNEEENAPSPMGERISPKSREYQDDIYTTQPAQSEYSSGNYLSQSGNHSSGMQEIYPQGQEQGSYAASDTDTMVEIAQQVFSEKIRKIQQNLESFNEFKILYQTKTDSISERLRKIENVIDRLQSAILEKVGSYGAGIENVRKEMSMMQDTYGKIVDAVSEKHHSHQHHQAQEHQNHSAPAPAQVSEPKSAPTHHTTTHHIVHHSAPKNHSSKAHSVSSKKHSKKKK